MRPQFHALMLVIAGLVSVSAPAQTWDAVNQAKGWGRTDVTGALALYDPAAQIIHIWTRDGALSGEVSLAKLEQKPEKWAIDSTMNAWVVSGSTLYHIDKTGKIKEKTSLAGEVSDLAWDARSFYLVYRSTEPYVEKREFKNGDVVWSYGNKPKKDTLTTLSLFRIALTDGGNPLLAVGNGTSVLPLDAKGKVQNLIQFTQNGKASPALKLMDKDRAPIATWFGRNALVAAVRPSEWPGSEGKNWILLKQDLGSSTMTVLPTPISEDHQFLGLIESEAVFTKPEGGLAFHPLE